MCHYPRLRQKHHKKQRMCSQRRSRTTLSSNQRRSHTSLNNPPRSIKIITTRHRACILQVKLWKFYNNIINLPLFENHQLIHTRQSGNIETNLRFTYYLFAWMAVRLWRHLWHQNLLHFIDLASFEPSQDIPIKSIYQPREIYWVGSTASRENVQG